MLLIICLEKQHLLTFLNGRSNHVILYLNQLKLQQKWIQIYCGLFAFLWKFWTVTRGTGWYAWHGKKVCMHTDNTLVLLFSSSSLLSWITLSFWFSSVTINNFQVVERNHIDLYSKTQSCSIYPSLHKTHISMNFKEKSLRLTSFRSLHEQRFSKS